MSSRKQRSSAKVISHQGDGDSFVDSFVDDNKGQRQNEKDTLQRLNTRLAEYIEKVRHLEKENERLMVSIKDTEVVEKREKTNLAVRYENELIRLRDSLEARNGELVKLEVERDTAVAAMDELKKKCERLERDWKLAADNERRTMGLVDDLQARMSKLNKDNTYLDKTNKDLEKELALLRDQNSSLKKNLEDESILRASLQSKLDAALEDLRFQTGNLRTQLEEEHKKRQVEMTTVSRRLETEYEDRLANLLEENRRRAMADITRNGDKLQAAYKSKLEFAVNEAKSAMEKEKEMRLQIREYELSRSGHEGSIHELEKKLNELEKRLANEQALKRDLLSMKDHELADRDVRIAELNAEISRLLSSYNELADAKILLDNELRDYETLLNEEESRLNISQRSPRVTQTTVTRTAESSTRSGVKRRRISDGDRNTLHYSHFKSRLESHQKGPIKIIEAEENGDSVKLENTGDEDVKVGGWIVKNRANGREVVYKFHSKAVIPANTTVTIWSSSTGKKSSSVDFVMKSNTWPGGPTPDISVEDHDGEKVAWQEMVHSTLGEMDSDPNERCSIM